jgi:hypothetical protein
MSSDFITVARFNAPAGADRAKARLDAAGIRALLVEREAKGPNWHLEKQASVLDLLVAPDDEDRAVDVLNRPDVERAHEAAVSEERLPAISAEVAGEDSDSPPDIVSSREELVDRAFKAQIISVVFWPLQIYALYCILTAVRSPLSLREASRRRLNLTIAIHIVWWLLLAFFVGFFGMLGVALRI